MYDLGTRQLQLAAGSGELAVHDGSGDGAAFAEPVALAAVQQLVYVCDGAGSAIRSLNVRNRQVTTLVGRDPWNHGQADGARSDARLQRPAGDCAGSRLAGAVDRRQRQQPSAHPAPGRR